MRREWIIYSIVGVALVAAIILAASFLDSDTKSNATQQTCKMDLSVAPTLRGLRLGMSAEELKARYPHLEIQSTYSGEGWSFAEVFDGDQASKEFDFEGLWGLRLEFFDGKLSYIQFNYISQPGYARRPDELLDKVVEQLGLDARWCDGSRTPTCLIKCDGFEVSITTPETSISEKGISMSSPMVSFRDVIAGQQVEARRRAREAEERKKFKP